MRRLVQHVLIGTAVCATTAGFVVGTINQSAPIAEAQPQVITTALPLPPPSATPSASPAAAVNDRAVPDSRSTGRPALASQGDPTATAAKKRSLALTKQHQGITVRKKALIAAEKKKAAEKKAAEKKAAEKRKAAAKARGYDPTETDPREIARQIMDNKYSWGNGEFGCYDKLIKSESMWRVNATNPSSGAYGIPQSLPGNKMASAGSDWQTNPATQIIWGLQYVKQRYGTPCSAWGFKQGHNWY